MLQRIQTVFLLLALLSIGACFLWPRPIASHSEEAIAALKAPDKGLAYYWYKTETYDPGNADPALRLQSVPFHLGLTLLITITLLIALTIFQYKKLKRQMFMALGASLLACILATVVLLTGFTQILNALPGVRPELNYLSIAMPLLAEFFAIFAIVYIRKDLKLLKSIDRIR